MIATYDAAYIVAFSVVSAVITSYPTLDLATSTAATRRARHFWLASGAIAIGTGV